MNTLSVKENFVVRMALFDNVDSAAESIAKLKEAGIDDHDMTVLSGVPYPEHVLGRPMTWERLPLIAMSGAGVGFLIGLFLNVVTPLLYPIRVGGQPFVAIPPTIVLTYELTMMGLIVSTFLGVLWESTFPSFGPKYYDIHISEGEIGVLFQVTPSKLKHLTDLLQVYGAKSIIEPEEWRL
ncbi:MAG: DUF3341 domain-containing protein [Chloroflexi bacterium]|nr:MAG: DUF3341 domain-containing protein [Chloroflexota bacterium]